MTRLRKWTVCAVVASGGASGLGLALEPRRAAFSFLFAFVWLATIVVGALVFLAIAHTTNAGWMVVLRRPAEDIAGVAPLLAVLFLPVALTAHLVFPWAMPPETWTPEVRSAVLAKHGYLTVPFMTVRSLAWLSSWAVLASVLRRQSRLQDDSPNPALVDRQRRLSAATLPWLAFSVTFGTFDWVMSLDPTWSSNVLGIYAFTGGFGAACGAIAAASFGPFPSRVTVATRHHAHALGRLLLTFVIFWAYIAFTQYLIVWIADLPREVPWVARRTAGPWAWVAVALVATHFVIPFALLLSRRLKLEPRWVAWLGGLLVLAHVIDVYWLVMPEASMSAGPEWVDVTSLAFVASLALLSAAIGRRGAREVPLADPRLPRGLAYEASR